VTPRPAGATARRPGPRAPGRASSTVSKASAARFAARVRARRLRRVTAVLGTTAAVVLIGWVALLSPWATVQRIQVTGLERLPEDQVRAIGRTQLGSPLFLVDTDNLARSVRGLDLVREVSIRRSWPSTLVIEVAERTAVAAVPVGKGTVLVDVDGVAVEEVAVAEVPDGLPMIGVELFGDGGPAAFRAAFAVWNGLPEDIRGQIRRIGADGADGVWTVQINGSRVLWGSPGELERKVAALRALWSLPPSARPASKIDYDVSAPRAPAVRPRD
jgi:cell division protein FtsQ